MVTNTKIDSTLVSVLMLTYNREHFISEAITSVINQTHKNWELVIIDDGSTDNTENVVNSFNDSRIKYIKHLENKGLFARRSESLSYITGKYTAILDSDDYWNNSDKLSKQVSFLEKNIEHIVVGTTTNLVDFSGQKIGKQYFSLHDFDIRKKILIRNQFTHSSILVRSDLISKTMGYQPTLAEDLDLILQLGKLGQLANLDSFDTTHRVHIDSVNDHGLEMAKAVHNIIMRHRNDYPNFLKAIIFSHLRILKGYAKRLSIYRH